MQTANDPAFRQVFLRVNLLFGVVAHVWVAMETQSIPVPSADELYLYALYIKKSFCKEPDVRKAYFKMYAICY